MTRALTAIRAQHWAQINESSFILGMRLLFWLWRAFGKWPFRIVLYPVLLWHVFANRGARAASRGYFSRLSSSGNFCGEPRQLAVLRHFAAFAETILDKMLLWTGFFNLEQVKSYGNELIAAQIAARRGGIFICSHLGNLDLCRVLSKDMPGLKMTVLLHTKHSERFNRLLAQLNPDSQIDVMQVSELSSATAVLLADKVNRGEFVAIAGDRIPVSANPRVALASFLGETAPFPIGPYILASLFQCSVYLVFSFRAESGPEIHFELFRDSIRLPRQRRNEALAGLVKAYATRLEFFCRRAPLQWFNFYDFWRLPGVDTPNVQH
jgi:predicted LPLAT superfamily acyltransferase